MQRSTCSSHYCSDYLSDGCIRSNPSGCSTQDSGTVFQKIQGRKQVGGQSTYIPLKVNTGGVIPVIFAQSLMQFPVVIATIARKNNGDGVGSKILKVVGVVLETIKAVESQMLVRNYKGFLND